MSLPADAPRCHWARLAPDDYRHYHDTEWGRPVADDQRLFEKLCLEGFQAGLSWLTILRKREAFRAAFAGFDIETVARFGPADVARLLADPGIVRHRGKIEAAIRNASRALALREAFGSIAAFVWRHEPDPGSRPTRLDEVTLRALTESRESRGMSRELKRRGWAFVGPTTLYAFMQSVGVVNDHAEDCALRAPVEAEREAFRRPV
jgi:DNA-3-methyladenine glycosylase I